MKALYLRITAGVLILFGIVMSIDSLVIAAIFVILGMVILIHSNQLTKKENITPSEEEEDVTETTMYDDVDVSDYPDVKVYTAEEMCGVISSVLECDVKVSYESDKSENGSYEYLFVTERIVDERDCEAVKDALTAKYEGAYNILIVSETKIKILYIPF